MANQAFLTKEIKAIFIVAVTLALFLIGIPLVLFPIKARQEPLQKKLLPINTLTPKNSYAQFH